VHTSTGLHEAWITHSEEGALDWTAHMFFCFDFSPEQTIFPAVAHHKRAIFVFIMPSLWLIEAQVPRDSYETVTVAIVRSDSKSMT